MQQRREELALEAAREGGKPLIDSLVEVDRAIDSIRLVRRTSAGAGAAREIPMGRNAASAGRLAFTQHEPIGVGRGLQRVQSSAEHDRAPGGPGGGRRLPGDRQAGQGDAAVLPAAGADPPRGRPAGRVVPAAGDDRPRIGPGNGRRPPRGLLQLHRQRRGGLDAPRTSGPGHALLAGARRRGAGDRRRRRRSGRRACRCWPRAVSITPARSACRCSGFLPSGRSPDRWPSGWPSWPSGLKVGDPTLPETDVGPLIRPREVAARRRVGAGGGPAAGRAAVRRPGRFGQLLRADRAAGPARRLPA